MPQHEYDIITVGGGLAGATLAKAMAENGVRVLVIERERQFKVRVRGEGTFPWVLPNYKNSVSISYCSILARAASAGKTHTWAVYVMNTGT